MNVLVGPLSIEDLLGDVLVGIAVLALAGEALRDIRSDKAVKSDMTYFSKHHVMRQFTTIRPQIL